jgi:hypothetical protein
MKITRLYEDEDGASHFDEIEVGMSFPPISMSAVQDTCGMVFMAAQGSTFMPAHRAPRRQFMIVLEGEWECEATDGETRRFAAGKILLAEDTAGVGHTTRTLTDEGVLVAAIVLA